MSWIPNAIFHDNKSWLLREMADGPAGARKPEGEPGASCHVRKGACAQRTMGHTGRARTEGPLSGQTGHNVSFGVSNDGDGVSFTT